VRPPAIFEILAAFSIIAYAGYAIKTGRARFRLWTDQRSKKPIAFWADIIIYGMLAGGFLLCAYIETFGPINSN
jgi:hypothetical protein